MLNYFLFLDRVSIGSFEHLFPIIFAIIFAVLIIKYSKKSLAEQQQIRLIHFIAIGISFTVITFHIYHISIGNYNVTTDLPLYLCSLIAILIPIFTYYRAYWMFEILVFWIIAGTTQGIVTPDIAEGFPSFDYFRYWMVHLGLLIVIFYYISVFKLKPKFKSVFKSFFALQLYIILMMGINYYLKANYFYLNEKPKSATLLDFFGEWPIYIIVVQLIIIPVFYIIYLMFSISKLKSFNINN
jgi:hypothetical integral membrane protein (TIGR02206 family)